MRDRVIIITGASSGIGRACAFEFAARGATVVITGRNADRLRETEEVMKQRGAETLAVAMDVSCETDCRAMAEKTVARYGRIDVLVNNAGFSMRALFAHTDPGVLRRIMDTNFWGTVYCTKYALPYILERRGSIAGISSVAGYKGIPGRTGYSASKFAVHGFLESLRIENLDKGLHVLLACPGFTASNIRNVSLDGEGKPLGGSPRAENKMMTAEEVARHIAKAIIKRKRTIVLTTQGKLTVLLNRFFPAWTDRLVFRHFVKEEGRL